MTDDKNTMQLSQLQSGPRPPDFLITREVLRLAVAKLQNTNIASASLDGRILLEYVLGVNREQLLFLLDLPITSEQYDRLKVLIERRCKKQPIAQLVGKREFWGMEFAVTADTLDPRPDSETLIECVLDFVRNRAENLRVLDLGTGTGCLLLSILSELPLAGGVGVDFSDAALVVAKQNSVALGLEKRAKFIKSNWFEDINKKFANEKFANEKFDIIISNPPYIPTEIIPTLDDEVAIYEPRLALDGGKDGLDCYRIIIKSLKDFLKIGGFAVFEFGIGQRSGIEKIAQENNFVIVGTKYDLNKIERCIALRHKGFTA